MWNYNKDVSIALGVTTIISGIACYYMYNGSGNGGSSTAVLSDSVSATNKVITKTWDMSRLFGYTKSIAVASAGIVTEGNKDLTSP